MYITGGSSCYLNIIGMLSLCKVAAATRCKHCHSPIVFDPKFLAWAVTQHTTSGIANFLGVDHSTLWNALLEYGLATPGQNPFPNHDGNDPATFTSDVNSNLVDLNEGDDILEPNIPIPIVLPSTLMVEEIPSTSVISTISNRDLDDLILHLCSHFHRAGIAMLDGMLHWLGHRVQQERIHSL
jgi:hypothetical protein